MVRSVLQGSREPEPNGCPSLEPVALVDLTHHNVGVESAEMSSVHPEPVRSIIPRTSVSDIRSVSTLYARSPVKMNRSNASLSTT